MGKHSWFEGYWTIKHVRDGKIIWEETKQNALTDQGELAILESFFRGAASYTPSVFYVRLCNDALVSTDTLLTVLNEPSGNGYSGQTVERATVGFPLMELSDGDYRITSKELTFTATGGNIGPINTVFLATTSDSSGTLLSYLSLSLSRTILSGDSMISQYRIKLK